MPYVATRLGRWFYDERGRGRTGDPALVLLHSYLCDRSMWRHQVPRLAELGRVLVFDGPGHGRSEVPSPFTLEDHADVLAEVLLRLEAPRVVILGLSWGGMVGMRMALGRPHQVAGLALLDTSARREGPWARAKYAGLLPVGRFLGVPPFLSQREIEPLMFGPLTLRTRPDLVEDFRRTLSGFPRDGIAVAGRAVVVERSDISDRLATLRTPTLVLCGRDDRATVPAESELLVARIPDARVTWIENAGHLSALEAPDAVSDALERFVGGILGA